MNGRFFANQIVEKLLMMAEIQNLRKSIHLQLLKV